MMEEVDDLVLTSFRDIVDKARTALLNASEENPVMLKAAQALLKEGERAIRRIEPQCRRHLDDYGSSFIAALKDNDEIATFRAQLTDLLWEFEDYVELDDFDADKFTELQMLSRKAAPRISDALLRMKIEAPTSDAASSRGSIAQLPTPTSPHAALMHGFTSQPHRGSAGSSMADSNDASSLLRGLMLSPTGHDSIHNAAREQPRPTSATHSDWNAKAGDDGGCPIESPVDGRAEQNESPVLPKSTLEDDPNGKFTVVLPPPVSATGGGFPAQQIYEMEDRRSSTISAHGHHQHHHSPHPQRRQPTLPNCAIPEHEVTSAQPGSIPFFQPSQPFSPTSQHSRQHSFPLSEQSDEPPRPDLSSLPSHGDPRARGNSFNSSIGASPLQPPTPTIPGAQPIVQPSAEMIAMMGSAPIPVETEIPAKPSIDGSGKLKGAKIDEASSFLLAKGFCEGAKEVIRGGIGVKRTKKPGFATAATVARCLACLYELDFAEIETDVNGEDKGNFQRNGINFRAGRTIHDSDATVFFNQKALFEHLARHPRPLPEVPGVTVIEGSSLPEKYRNDYDIHFKQPTRPHPVIERADELIYRPSAVSLDQARRMYGQRLLYDRSPALELAQGARISGLTWPSKYNGEWAFGWHDAHYASVPTLLLKLDAPSTSEIRYERSSIIRAKARWRFSVKEKEKNADWLKFDKGDIITNISYVDFEHWCWTGTNAKGKSGIFPKDFLDPATISEPTSTATANRAGSLSEEKARSASSMLSKFSIRKNMGRPTSISG
ncbi:uncharacterized protein J7T54_007080 [Emericellopsis cladophorae]|uniref:SH3 domain-containing protein n=1 Tax=Emericellopsis cladophorae TaxID=2686198 RepID=A0A9P9Y987_9HYPO|nr:uncharacterized protein J7T54_007080 [Emericellopsis cladophorae]KAI6785438.1 hypothetical protein J7T54_007080 [Emericellopsis cladophorae]